MKLLLLKSLSVVIDTNVCLADQTDIQYLSEKTRIMSVIWYDNPYQHVIGWAY